MIKECKSDSDLIDIIENSKTKPQMLLKHSTRCPVSKTAMFELKRFAEKYDTADLWQISVLDSKELSQKIAEETGIEHKSPQIILFRDGKVSWNASHHFISLGNLEKAVAES